MNAQPIRIYHHQYNYQEGDRVLIDFPRIGKSLATITKLIRQPDRSCDKAVIEFDNPDLKFSPHNSSAYFAVDVGRTGRTAPVVETIPEELLPKPPVPIRKRAPAPTQDPLQVQPLPQTAYYEPILQFIAGTGAADTIQLRRHLRSTLPLTPADWVPLPNGKNITWRARFYRAIQTLKRTGAIVSSERGLYRRSQP